MESVMSSENNDGPKQRRLDYEMGDWHAATAVFIGAIALMGTAGVTIAGHSPWLLMGTLPTYWIGVWAYRRYRKDGRLTRGVFSIAVFAVLPLAYMTAMILGHSISGLWPLGIIVAGVAMLLNGSSAQASGR